MKAQSQGEQKEEYYPGKQYQRLFSHLMNSFKVVAILSEMQEVISIVHEDFPSKVQEKELIYKQEQLLEKQELEIERLKGLIRIAFDKSNMWRGEAKEKIWNEFKKENNL